MFDPFYSRSPELYSVERCRFSAMGGTFLLAITARVTPTNLKRREQERPWRAWGRSFRA